MARQLKQNYSLHWLSRGKNQNASELFKRCRETNSFDCDRHRSNPHTHPHSTLYVVVRLLASPQPYNAVPCFAVLHVRAGTDMIFHAFTNRLCSIQLTYTATSLLCFMRSEFYECSSLMHRNMILLILWYNLQRVFLRDLAVPDWTNTIHIWWNCSIDTVP